MQPAEITSSQLTDLDEENIADSQILGFNLHYSSVSDDFALRLLGLRLQLLELLLLHVVVSGGDGHNDDDREQNSGSLGCACA